MKQYAKVTPEGSRDLLFEECDDRRRVENALTGLYEANGYRKVITPTLEFFDVFNSGDAGLDADEMYKLTDNRGRTTVLRPDNTLPIARLVATRLSEDAFPVRLYYNQSVFVRTKELAGRTDEVAQSGIELIGDGSMAADIQVITLACRAMQSTVPGFKIELGHAGYFGAVLRNLNVKPAVKAEICSAGRFAGYLGGLQRDPGTAAAASAVWRPGGAGRSAGTVYRGRRRRLLAVY